MMAFHDIVFPNCHGCYELLIVSKTSLYLYIDLPKSVGKGSKVRGNRCCLLLLLVLILYLCSLIYKADNGRISSIKYFRVKKKKLGKGLEKQKALR